MNLEQNVQKRLNDVIGTFDYQTLATHSSLHSIFAGILIGILFLIKSHRSTFSASNKSEIGNTTMTPKPYVSVDVEILTTKIPTNCICIP